MSIKINILTDFDGKALERARKEFAALETNAQKAGYVAKKALLPATAALGALAVAARSAVNEASDLGESINAVGVTFEDSAEEILKLSAAASKAVGLSRKDFNGLAVQFSSFAYKIAGDGGDVAKVMQRITQRAADFASVMNIDVADAAAKFQSGLAGEAEPLKKFGLDLSDAAVKSFALANGLGIVTAKGVQLDEAEKVLARYGLIMEQTEKTAGDFANTSDSLANRQRILNAQMTDFKATLGQALLPVMEQVAGVAVVFSDWAMKHPGTFQIIAAAIGAVAAAVVAVNNAMAINPFTAIAAGVAALVVGVVAAYKKFEGFRNIVDAVFQGLKTGVRLAIDNFTMLLNVWKNVFNGIARLWNNSLGKLSISIPDIPGLPGRGKSFGIPNIPYLADGGIVTGPTLAVVGEAGPEVVIPLDRLGSMGAGAGTTVNISVNGGDPQAVVDALRRYMYQNGSVPIRVTG